MSTHRNIGVQIAAIVAGGALALAGCSSGDGGGSSADGNGTEDSAIKIGIALPAGNETFWTGWQRGAQTAADELGVEVTFTDARNDAQTMNDQINTLIASGVDGIAMATVDPQANAVAVEAAAEAGIPLITSNRSVDVAYGGADGNNPRVHTGFNDIQIGEMQAQLVIDACEDVDPCNVVEQVGTLGSTPQIQRSEGLRNGLEGNDNIVIIDQRSNDFDPTKAVELTQTILQAHSDIDVITTQEDPSANAVVTVLKEQGIGGDITVIGIGGSIDGVDAVEAGDIFGTVKVSSQDDGATSVRTLVAIIQGEAIEVDDSGDRPTVIVPATLVNKENAADNPGDW